MHVTMLTPWRMHCGISDYSHHLISELRALPDVAEVTIVEPPEDAARAAALEALRAFASDERRYRDLGRAVNATGADLLHVQHQYFFFGGVAPHKNHTRAFLDAVRLPVVMTVHEIAQAGQGAGLMARAAVRQTSRTNFLHSAIRAYIVHTGQDREALIAVGAHPERVRVVTHGVPPAAPLPEARQARRALGLDDRRVLTLFGFLSMKKGHSVALEAMKRLPPDTTLLLAGDRHPDDRTDYVSSLRAAIAGAALEDRVRITGYLPPERIPEVMAATEVALAPYVRTSGSGSLANLLAYGRAVVASDIAPHREIAAEHPACLSLFRSGDAADLAAAVQALLTDPNGRADLQAAARTYAARHSYAEMARETVSIYRSVMGEPAAG